MANKKVFCVEMSHDLIVDAATADEAMDIALGIMINPKNDDERAMRIEFCENIEVVENGISEVEDHAL